MDDNPTVEDIQAHLEHIRGEDDYVLPTSLADEIELARSVV